MSSFGPFSGAAVLRNLVRVAAIGAIAAVLASCGDGTQVVEFTPQRVLVFGDETSVITSAGRKYTINALKSDDVTLDCATNPIWVQTVASSFGLVFPECNPDGVADPRSRIMAAPGVKVAGLTAQVTAHLASDSFSGTDLVTMLVGTHDVLDIYAQYPGISADAAVAAAETAGEALAAQVNRVANAGGKVLIGLVLDLGQTPFGLAEKADADKQDTDRAALLTRLASRFNAKLRVNVLNDGRMIGLVLTDERIQNVVSYPSNYSFTNVTNQSCLSTVVAPDCTTLTLVTDSDGTAATSFTYLWADSLNLSPGGQFRIGELAASVAQSNPF